MSFNIAIDGTAGAGKSSIARRVAEQLGFIYVDTGAMYRTIALGLMRRGTDCADDAQLEQALAEISVEIAYRDGEQQMLLNGENVTGQIRTEEVSKMASISSARPQVRAKLLWMQRTIAQEHDVLMDGRDIGTQILPDAQLKIFLTASIEERARRRYLEQTQKGIKCTLGEISEEIRDRDYRDTHRETSPLVQAEDAVLVDTSDMSIDQVVEYIIRLTEEKRAEGADAWK